MSRLGLIRGPVGYCRVLIGRKQRTSSGLARNVMTGHFSGPPRSRSDRRTRLLRTVGACGVFVAPEQGNASAREFAQGGRCKGRPYAPRDHRTGSCRRASLQVTVWLPPRNAPRDPPFPRFPALREERRSPGANCRPARGRYCAARTQRDGQVRFPIPNLQMCDVSRCYRSNLHSASRTLTRHPGLSPRS